MIAIKLPEFEVLTELLTEIDIIQSNSKPSDTGIEVKERKFHGVPVWELNYAIPSSVSEIVNASLAKSSGNDQSAKSAVRLASYVRKSDGAPIGPLTFNSAGKPVSGSLAIGVDVITDVSEGDFAIPLGYKVFFPKTTKEFQFLIQEALKTDNTQQPKLKDSSS